MIDATKLKFMFEFFDSHVADGTITSVHPPAGDNKLIEFRSELVAAQNMTGEARVEAFQALAAKCDGTISPPDFIEGPKCESFHVLLDEFAGHCQSNGVGGNHAALKQQKQVN